MALIQAMRSLVWAIVMGVSMRIASLEPWIRVQAMGDQRPPVLPLGFFHGIGGAV